MVAQLLCCVLNINSTYVIHALYMYVSLIRHGIIELNRHRELIDKYARNMLRDVLKHLLISSTGVIIGILAFFILFVVYGNHDVGFWSILTGVLAGVCFHLHWVKGKETLERWHSRITLRNLNVVGFVSAVAGITAFIWYLFLTFYYNIPIQPISESSIISATWSIICGKWGIVLMYYSYKYELLIQEGTAPILTDSA